MMSSWAIVAVIAIIVWGVVQLARGRGAGSSEGPGGDDSGTRAEGRSEAELDEARREIEALRERVHVLERIATDSNSLDARERARIAAEIEALRLPLETPADKEDKSR